MAENAQYWPEIVETQKLLTAGAIGDVLCAYAKYVVRNNNYTSGRRRKKGILTMVAIVESAVFIHSAPFFASLVASHLFCPRRAASHHHHHTKCIHFFKHIVLYVHTDIPVHGVPSLRMRIHARLPTGMSRHVWLVWVISLTQLRAYALTPTDTALPALLAGALCVISLPATQSRNHAAVSYTHLTLPTIYSV